MKILITVMVIPVGAAQVASKQIPVNGQITLAYVEGSWGNEKVVGARDPVIWEDTIVQATFLFDVTYTGTIAGTATETVNARWNSKQGEYPTFKFTSDGIQTFTGTVQGKAGTFTARVRHQGYLDGHTRVEETIMSGTGELANLHGTLIFDVYAMDVYHHTGTYSGKLHFAP